MKFLIVGLGNIGVEYVGTRHNAGFMIADCLVNVNKAEFVISRYAARAEFRLRGMQFVVIKPSTYMNESGKAVRYWMQAEAVDLSNVLVLVDDIALNLGVLRMKKNGSDGGHNGLTSIILTLNTDQFARLRFGIGNQFAHGTQINYVLGRFSNDERTLIQPKIEQATEMITSFAFQGADKTMTLFNNK
ncbi:peptidyl-tRNA hydrolase [Bacteroidia bacterium]|nr:peptidyl-tRNA hydrolase [Bacteroidia bacterium]